MIKLRFHRCLRKQDLRMLQRIVFTNNEDRASNRELLYGGYRRKFHSKRNKSQSTPGARWRSLAVWWLAALLGGTATVASGADDPGVRAVQQLQLQRQQQQDALQLRMQQQQRGTQEPSAIAPQQARQQLEVDQQQRQQELHFRQAMEPVTVQPSDDAGTRRAKAQLEEERARDQGQRQLLRFESEAQRRSEQMRGEKSRGEIGPAQPE
jgi:hypothetical protein